MGWSFSCPQSPFLPPSISPRTHTTFSLLSTSPESQTPEHLTSTGLPRYSVCPRHRRSVTSTRLIFSPGYKRLMWRERRGGNQHLGLPKALRSFSQGSSHLVLLWNCRGSVVLAEVLKGRRHHAELSTPVSLSVYLPLLRILHQLFELQYTLLSFLQQTVTSNTVSSGILKKKKKNNLWIFDNSPWKVLGGGGLTANSNIASDRIRCDTCPTIPTDC